MKAAVLYEINKPLVIEEIDIDEPGPGQVMVKTVSSGVCHSDLHQIEGTLPIDLPVVLGHEAAGIVERVGEGVTYVQPGDHVVMNFIPFCGACRYCQSGRPALCREGGGAANHLHKGRPAHQRLHLCGLLRRAHGGSGERRGEDSKGCPAGQAGHHGVRGRDGCGCRAEHGEGGGREQRGGDWHGGSGVERSARGSAGGGGVHHRHRCSGAGSWRWRGSLAPPTS